MRRAGSLLACVALAACTTNGDFGRVRPGLVHDDIHAWVGVEAAQARGYAPSLFRLTEEERLLRDLAYPLIEPPYDRQKWFSVLAEYGVTRNYEMSWDRRAYGIRLLSRPTRSMNAQYGRLNEDIRNDITRIPPFVVQARRVLDLDRKREQSLAYISALRPEEEINARNRIAENALVSEWVLHSLEERCEAYRYALERLVLSAPSPIAVDVERSLTLLQQRIAEARGTPPAGSFTRGPAPGPVVK